MEKNEALQKDVQDVIKWEPLLNAAETDVIAKVGKHMKKFIYLTSLAAIGLFFYACRPAYVASEPTYMETARPQSPGDGYIWIDGDWVYRRQTNGYARQQGYWERPNQRRTYVPGYWQATPRGNYWVAGHWQRQGRQMNNRNR